jgi:hypothetical protein
LSKSVHYAGRLLPGRMGHATSRLRPNSGAVSLAICERAPTSPDQAAAPLRVCESLPSHFRHCAVDGSRCARSGLAAMALPNIGQDLHDDVILITKKSASLLCTVPDCLHRDLT